MKYSYNWLQKHIEEKLPSPKSLKETIIFHAFEVESSHMVGEDTIFDIKVLPDRAGDCLSHYGMAREIAGLLKLTLKETKNPPLPDIPLVLPVEIKSDLCRRYIAIEMEDVKIGESPEWLKILLESVGQRPINNIVDVTNYILLDVGQPTHAFDRTKIDGGMMIRLAHDGETIITLSEETKTLSSDMLVIADYVGALAIAGVKGGKVAEIGNTAPKSDSEVLGSVQPDVPNPDFGFVSIAEEVAAVSDPKWSGRAESEGDPRTRRTVAVGATTVHLSISTSIILEIANFEPIHIRKTARDLGIQTDASKRFENNISPEGARIVAEQLVALIKAVAGGEVVGVHDEYSHPTLPRTLSFSVADVCRVLGNTIDAYAVENVFDHYRYEYKKDDQHFILTVPYWRADIIGVHDIAEEIGRVIGYDRISAVPLPIVYEVTHSQIFQSIRTAKAWLVAEGYREVMTYTFTKNGQVFINHGPKDRSALRASLSEGLKESYELNRLNKPFLGLSDIKIFEIGTVFFADREEIHVAMLDKGFIQEVPLESFVAEHTSNTNATLSLERVSKYQLFVQWSMYPFVTRDIAVWVRNEHDKKNLEQIIDIFARQYCIRTPVLFDQFFKEGKISIAYRLVFQAYDRTLTEREVEEWFVLLTTRIISEKIYTIR